MYTYKQFEMYFKHYLPNDIEISYYFQIMFFRYFDQLSLHFKMTCIAVLISLQMELVLVRQDDNLNYRMRGGSFITSYVQKTKYITTSMPLDFIRITLQQFSTVGATTDFASCLFFLKIMPRWQSGCWQCQIKDSQQFLQSAEIMVISP